MKLLFLSDALPPITDGVTRTLSRLVQTLLAEDIDFRFVSAWKPDAPVAWSQNVWRIPSIPFGLYDYYRLSLPYLQGLKPELDGFRPDLVHVVSPTPLGIWGMRYARSRRIPAVTSYHTRFVSYLPYYRLKRLAAVAWVYLRWFHNEFQATYAPSPSARDELRQHGIRSVRLWPRGIDCGQFSPRHRSSELRAHYGVGAKPLILFVGRLVKEKDLDLLIEACLSLEARGHAFEVALVGDGPMRKELQLRLPNSILPGFQSGSELARWYASADIFAFPSTTETFGNVILEAGASGLPVVCPDAGGVRDLVTSGRTGLLTRPHSASDFAAKLEILLVDSALRTRLGRYGQRSALGHDWHTVNTKLLDSYRETISDWHTHPAVSSLLSNPYLAARKRRDSAA